jgi:hypothetical protein
MEPYGFVRLGFLSGLPQAGRKAGLVLAHHPNRTPRGRKIAGCFLVDHICDKALQFTAAEANGQGDAVNLTGDQAQVRAHMRRLDFGLGIHNNPLPAVSSIGRFRRSVLVRAIGNSIAGCTAYKSAAIDGDNVRKLIRARGRKAAAPPEISALMGAI